MGEVFSWSLKDLVLHILGIPMQGRVPQALGAPAQLSSLTEMQSRKFSGHVLGVHFCKQGEIPAFPTYKDIPQRSQGCILQVEDLFSLLIEVPQDVSLRGEATQALQGCPGGQSCMRIPRLHRIKPL